MNVFNIKMGIRLFTRFMPHAYALLLLRRDGIPCVFFGDCTVSLVRFPRRQRALGNFLVSCLRGNCMRSHGLQVDYFERSDCAGRARQGDLTTQTGAQSS
jgi:alpha-amylase